MLFSTHPVQSHRLCYVGLGSLQPTGSLHRPPTSTADSLYGQKRPRLQEARRLILGEGLDTASAAFRVGYNGASYFNREYKLLFWLSPVQDTERLRETAGQTADLKTH